MANRPICTAVIVTDQPLMRFENVNTVDPATYLHSGEDVWGYVERETTSKQDVKPGTTNGEHFHNTEFEQIQWQTKIDVVNTNSFSSFSFNSICSVIQAMLKLVVVKTAQLYHTKLIQAVIAI